MSDSYQLCPGGTGKKLKFCCADLVHELPKLEKMIEGEQRLACLEQIQRLEQKFPGRACLLTYKAMIQSALGKYEDATVTLDQFAQVHPENVIALSQQALAAGQMGDLRLAVGLFGKAMENCPQEMPPVVYQALSGLADQLLSGKQTLASLAVLRAQIAFAPQDNQIRQALNAVERAPSLPLLLRDDTYPQFDPRQADLIDPPQQEAYLDALRHMFHLRYARTLAELESVAAQAPDVSEVWRTLGYVRAYAVDIDGATAALRKFAAAKTPEQDAVEAEALAQLLGDEDSIDDLFVEFPISDADQVVTALGSSQQIIPMPIDPHMAEEGQPPPRAAFAITDRPVTDNPEVAADAIPLIMGRAALFGKQTDREARLEISTTRKQQAELQDLLEQWLPDTLGTPSEPEVVSRQRLTSELLRAELQLPRGLAPDRSRTLQAEILRQRVLEIWPTLPLHSLDGKTPLEAAKTPELNRRLQAALLILELDVEATGAQVDFAPLRDKLGLSAPAPLATEGLDLERVPLVRLRHVDVTKLNDEQLTTIIERATAFDLRAVTKRAAEQVIARPTLLEKLGSDRIYYVLAGACDDPQAALAALAAGRAAAMVGNRPTVVFDLQELELHAAQRNMPEVERLLNYVLRVYGAQPGVREAVASVLMQAGIMIAPPQGAGPGMAPPGTAPEPAAESSGLWTPDSARGAGGGGQKSSLWTPGMD